MVRTVTRGVNGSDCPIGTGNNVAVAGIRQVRTRCLRLPSLTLRVIRRTFRTALALVPRCMQKSRLGHLGHPPGPPHVDRIHKRSLLSFL